ncbi:PCNA-interacting partner [Merluccius polli]|uniref:PCNA-interacting partner n=1 Tax=Merluccius polli TaxID=89951 RepID=A0AA47NWD0_MERPO|nr:PCNA-interacting partner [Merluccius polli]
MDAMKGRLGTMVDVFRRHCCRLTQSERVTVQGADAMLVVLQLALAEVNKQDMGEFKVALSDVFVAWKYLLLDKLHLPLDNLVRPENYDLILKAYESFLKGSNTVDLVDLHSLYNRLRVEPVTAESLNPVQLFEFLSGKADDPPTAEPAFPSTPSSRRGPGSSRIKTEVRRVFLSYLELLVNSKNDLALARVLDIPSRALGRAAFTDLKHAARRANTSLFLAVTSFVRAIQLGGKGYAPAESDPLRKHVKGLSDFVQFLDNLEEILGEIPDPCVCGGRLVAAIRAALVKGRSSEDAVCAAAAETARDLKERIAQLHRRQPRSDGAAATTGISPARPRAHAINHATALGGRDTVKVLMALLDQEALAAPCRNKADLLSEDPWTSLAGDEGTSMLTLFRSPEAAAGDSPEPLKTRVQSRQDLLKPKVRPGALRSQFACTYRDEEEPPLNRVLDFPSGSQIPTCVHPAPKPGTGAEEGPDCGSCVRARATQTSPRSRAGGRRRTAAKERRQQPEERGQLKRVTQQASQNNPGSKRKQADTDHHRDSENQPPAKRSSVAAAAAPGKPPVKSGPRGPSKKKLLAGQGKLTSFFRV